MPVISASIGSGATRVTQMIGRVAEDIVDGTAQIKVLIPQLNPAASGAVQPEVAEAVVSTTTPEGTVEQQRTRTTNVITAHYLGASNVKYRPTVRRGEQVMVYQFGDSDLYYWQSLGRDPELRQLDVYRIEVSNKTELNSPLTDDNTYFFELNTKTSQVTLKTSTGQGEVAQYMFQIDAAAGTILLGDDQGNSVFIDSQKPQVRLANRAGTMVDLQGPDAMAVAPRDLVLKAGRQIVYDAPMLTNRNPGGVTKLSAGALAIEATSAVTLQAPAIGLNGQITVDGSIVATDLVQAPNFATGTGTPYTPADTNIVDGTSAIPSNTPGTPAVSPEARHSAAYEQVVELAEKLVVLFDEIKLATAVPETDYSDLPTIATAAQMPKNTGE